MAKYRKLPIIVDAVQWHKHGDHPLVRAYDESRGWIDTLEGGHIVTPEDWIITGVQGETYPCKPDIFSRTYERVRDTSLNVGPVVRQ